ncbi:flavin reductase family protein [Sphingomonas flavalba]|uniref:flavin reductase family protein n=1 Tax=Sphingomonas flavalba TaxID=2559804 RepID=UPI0039E1D6F3
MSAIDSATFRSVLSSYATGVAVMTCTARNGCTGVMTVNSFASLSLDPPLVLWSIDKGCDQMPAFADTDHYAVNILAADQQDISNRLAMPGEDKLRDIPHEKGAGNAPLLPDCCAQIQCEIADRFEGGDHVILIGRVLTATRNDRDPLVYHGGGYRELK